MTHSSETKDGNNSAANYTSLVTLVRYGSTTKHYRSLQVHLPYSQNSKSSNKRQYRGQPLRLKAGPVGEAPRPVSFSPRISLRVSFAPPIAFTPCLIGGNTEPPATPPPASRRVLSKRLQACAFVGIDGQFSHAHDHVPQNAFTLNQVQVIQASRNRVAL